MKTWARAKAVMKSVAKAVMPEKEVASPNYNEMSWVDLKVYARKEGIKIGGKTKDELRDDLWACWTDDNE
jgi:hypothetical protein